VKIINQVFFKNMQKIFLGIFLTVLFLAGLAGFYFYTKYTKIVVKDSGSKFVLPSPKISESPARIEINILLLGYGGGSHEGGTLTDTMMVVSINPTTKAATFISGRNRMRR